MIPKIIHLLLIYQSLLPTCTCRWLFLRIALSEITVQNNSIHCALLNSYPHNADDSIDPFKTFPYSNNNSIFTEVDLND